VPEQDGFFGGAQERVPDTKAFAKKEFLTFGEATPGYIPLVLPYRKSIPEQINGPHKLFLLACARATC
jgi:hypothetical protein